MTVRRHALLAGSALALFAMVASTIPDALAQDATPLAQDATPVSQEASPARPVHIHTGDCVDLGDVVIPLTDLAAPVGDAAGQADEAAQAESSYTSVPTALDAILGADHAINVHLSADEVGTYIACGEIGGALTPDGALIIGLREDSESGFTGIAFLAPGADGASTDVSVFIAPVIGAAG